LAVELAAVGGGPAGVVELNEKPDGFAGVLAGPEELFVDDPPNIFGGALFKLLNMPPPEAGAGVALLAGAVEAVFSSFFRPPKLKPPPRVEDGVVERPPKRLGADVPDVAGVLLAPNIAPAGAFPVLVPKRLGVAALEAGVEVVLPPPNKDPPVDDPPPNKFEVGIVLPPPPKIPVPPGLDVAVAA
jgi:hypothetical protein